MKTNRMFTVVRLAVLAVMVAGFNAKAADVPSFQGKFTLASEIRWGQATLAAGDYSFTLDYAYPGNVVTIRRGTQTVTRIMSVGLSDMNSGSSEIVAENGAVREMNLPTIGVSLHYVKHNSGGRRAPRQVPMAQIIPVVVTDNGQ